MCDETTNSSYSEMIEWLIAVEHMEIPEKPIHPHFSYRFKLRYKYINTKLIIQQDYENHLKKGIRLPKWIKRSKNSFV